MIPFWNALYDYGAEVVVGGDDHLYERFVPQKPDGTLDPDFGITQFVAGTGGYLLYAFKSTPLPNSAARASTTHRGSAQARAPPDELRLDVRSSHRRDVDRLRHRIVPRLGDDSSACPRQTRRRPVRRAHIRVQSWPIRRAPTGGWAS